MQPTLLQMAWSILRSIDEYISPAPPPIEASVDQTRNESKISNDEASADTTAISRNKSKSSSRKLPNKDVKSRRQIPEELSPLLSKQSLPKTIERPNITYAGVDENPIEKSKNGMILPKRIRFIGYSAGGAVATFASMLTDGALNTTAASDDFLGKYKGRVKCISLGPPPCISRAVVPRYITSIICGDDLVPRSYPESIKSLRKRIGKSLKSGGGKGGIASWGESSTGWVKDLASVAKKGIEQYAGKQSYMYLATSFTLEELIICSLIAGGHDLNSISVAGRVFYLKSRQHKKVSAL